MNARFVPVAVLIGVVSSACSSGSDASFVAQCLDSKQPSEPPVVCTLRADGSVDSVTETELASGRSFAGDDRTGQIAAENAEGELIAVAGETLSTATSARTDSAYVFADTGELLALHHTGALRSADDTVVAEFDVSGTIDVAGGADISDGEIVFTSRLVDDTFVLHRGDIASGDVFELGRSDSFIGQARFSPDGNRLAVVGANGRSIEILDRAGTSALTIAPDQPELSGIFATPVWVDDATVLFLDAVPALVWADASSGEIVDTRVYKQPGTFPAFPVALQ